MVPERCLTLTAGTKASELGVQWPDIPRGKFLNASAERSNCFPFRPNDVTIRRQGTKAPVKTLESKRPSLAVNYMAHDADSQRFLLQGPLFSKPSARADSQKRRSPVPFRNCRPCSQAGELREGWVPMLALSYPNEASLCATALT